MLSQKKARKKRKGEKKNSLRIEVSKILGLAS